MDLAEPFAKSLQPRGERSLIGRWSFAITLLARAVNHGFDTRDRCGGIATFPPPRGRADHMTGAQVKIGLCALMI